MRNRLEPSSDAAGEASGKPEDRCPGGEAAGEAEVGVARPLDAVYGVRVGFG
jgi:hypothetical protein